MVNRGRTEAEHGMHGGRTAACRTTRRAAGTEVGVYRRVHLRHRVLLLMLGGRRVLEVGHRTRYLLLLYLFQHGVSAGAGAAECDVRRRHLMWLRRPGMYLLLEMMMVRLCSSGVDAASARTVHAVTPVEQRRVVLHHLERHRGRSGRRRRLAELAADATDRL